MDYSKKIKELKANLSEKTRKQVSLCSEINGLREDFKITHEEIAKVGEQLKLE